MADDYSRVFLSDSYVNYRPSGGPLSTEERAVRDALLLQQRVSENCIVRASVIGVSSAFIGALFGTFFFTIQANDIAHAVPTEKIGFRKQMCNQLQLLWPSVKTSARGFAKLGFVYSLFECIFQKRRAQSDIRNALYAGCTSGALLALKGGPLASAGGCIGFAAFSGLIEKYQQTHH
ncbi:mitochondrial import inner membrane translocase subunit Tim17 family protein [Babesia bovis T2Bo]|uniref:Mitochondrial import inner membrane translocase subunit TIM22 n=1 Tax=Babesia bovis TaxID=5865 RepID=A7AVL2_BABBO|nr:mitochondrial import inner membrane translocase subunit Tim17 family protein [Babesia bovis T2Bo]EDO05838.1 mitochondrial import inner membrane translocase subunit Tim17 family protein [Babesia bovis T2Bo]|eukprot:XP_001609406.1 mitochondrial import inner membrane translocase subunit Tim17 [Babesia bovis T2Bo]